jgi:hypothetical protein
MSTPLMQIRQLFVLRVHRYFLISIAKKRFHQHERNALRKTNANVVKYRIDVSSMYM